MSDAFVVGEDWISEHYFSTGEKQSFQKRVLDLRKAWDALEADGEVTPKAGLLRERGRLLKAFARFADMPVPFTENTLEWYEEEVLAVLERALGYGSGVWARETSGPVTRYAQVHASEVPVGAVVRALPVDDVADLLAKDSPTLVEPFITENGDELASVSRTLSDLFAGEEAPAFALVLAGTLMLVAERVRWAEGRYLLVDLQLVLDRNDSSKRGGEFDRAVAITAAESLLPAQDETVWWVETLAESTKHAIGVSKDLRDGVRESIEIIANEVVRRRAAQGLAPLPAEQANPLARQSLRYLYRILFLLYAEASPELRVLPVGAPEYALGYGLDRLRELVLVQLGEESKHRTHFYESLATLFRLVDAGSDRGAAETPDQDEPGTGEGLREGLEFHSLNADLFLPRQTHLIDEVGLGDGALQRVLTLLLLTREEKTKRGRDRGFISYAELGINQLGSVYEGLMSYTGFFAQEDLYEVAKDGDASKGSWVVPVSRSDHIPSQHFVRVDDPVTGEPVPRRYSGGEFVYRLSGRERQQSASYYTPEVLTRFVVSQALEELLDQDGQRTSAAEILELSVCEPALGSGAFAIEAVRQLAEEYLRRREEEVGQRVDPDKRPRELQRVKAAIALHQVYGVDLNETAVELAEISLWLDTMVEGLGAPWFGLRLRRGNSLIGARRQVYSAKQLRDRSWLRAVPTDVPVTGLAEEMREETVGARTSGSVHHFLLPAEGWGAACQAKEAKQLAPEAHQALNAWRRSLRKKPSDPQIKRLTSLAHRVETLWQFTLRRLEIAEQQVRRDVELWEDPRELSSGAEQVSRAEIEAFLHDAEGAYQRLRRVMDAWCALWFWPLTDTITEGIQPPSLDEWLDGLEELLGRHQEMKASTAAHGGTRLGASTLWSDLENKETLDLSFAGAAPIDEVLEQHPWLRVTERIAKEQGFFHWELDFAGLFSRGGFDLQVGNPPWVRPDFDSASSLGEYDPWWVITKKPSTREKQEHRENALQHVWMRDQYVHDETTVVCVREFVSSPLLYPHLKNLRSDLYRCFMEIIWRHNSHRGMVSLIHPESHFTDEKAGPLRKSTYRRLRRHWQFNNELKLFDIDHHVTYGIHVYGSPQAPSFLMASSLYHPDTVTASLKHDGSGAETGLKTAEGKWDTTPHAGRISTITGETLRTWHALLEEESTPSEYTRMAYTVNRVAASVLERLSQAPRLDTLNPHFSQGWNETTDFNKGIFQKQWGQVDSWQEAIIQGPHIFVGNPFYQSPNKTMRHNLDWSSIDLEALPSDATPTTVYKRTASKADYDAAYTHWGEKRVPARDHYRIAWRNMAANTGERTLIPAIIPPGTAHVHAVQSVAFVKHQDELPVVSASMGSLIYDALIRSLAPSTLSRNLITKLPYPDFANGLITHITLRSLRLLCGTEAYAELWESHAPKSSAEITWAFPSPFKAQVSLEDIDTDAWSPKVFLHRESDRRQALLEIDALIALSLGITADELCTIYRTQFPVLYGYDRNKYFYDANGRLVPNEVLKVWKKQGDNISREERTTVHPGSGVTYEYELPFITLDREADMRRAYAYFEQLLEEDE